MSTTIYTKTAGDLVREALLDASITGAETPVEVFQFESALTALNSELTFLQTTGVNIWRETEAFLPLNPNQSKYVLGVGGDHCFTDGVQTTASAFVATDNSFTVASTAGMVAGMAIGFELTSGERWWDVIDTVPDSTTVTTIGTAPSGGGDTVYAYADLIDQPVRILDARASNRYDQDEITTEQLSRQEYYRQPSKLSTGITTSWYYSRQLSVGHLMVWPVASNCRGVLRFSFVKPMTIPTDQAEQIEIPQEWYLAIRWAVAASLATTNQIDVQRIALCKANAEMYKAEALNIDIDMGSFSIYPDYI